MTAQSKESRMNHINITRFCCIGLFMALSACGDNTSTTGTSSSNAYSMGGNNTKTLESPADYNPPNPTDALATPAGIETSVEGNVIRLRWLPGTDTTVSYRVYWSEQPDVTQTSSYTDVYEAAYVHQGIITGNTYYFRVSAWRDNIESPLSTMLIIPTGTERSVGSDAAE
jgi:hypothetical protein